MLQPSLIEWEQRYRGDTVVPGASLAWTTVWSGQGLAALVTHSFGGPWRSEQRAASVKAFTSMGWWGGCIRGQQGREFPLPPQTEESLVQLYGADHHLPFDV